MGRKPNHNLLDEFAAYIRQNPDLKPAQIGHDLHLDSQTVQRNLAHLEARGDLLQEDNHGRLRWFGRCD